METPKKRQAPAISPYQKTNEVVSSPIARQHSPANVTEEHEAPCIFDDVLSCVDEFPNDVLLAVQVLRNNIVHHINDLRGLNFQNKLRKLVKQSEEQKQLEKLNIKENKENEENKKEMDSIEPLDIQRGRNGTPQKVSMGTWAGVNPENNVAVLSRVNIPPIVLKSHVYGSLFNPTEVDKELNILQQKNVIRLFKLPMSKDEYAIVFTEDFLKQIQNQRAKFEKSLEQENSIDNSPTVKKTKTVFGSPTNKQKPGLSSDEKLRCIDTFVEKVLSSYYDVTITKAELQKLMYVDGTKISEEHITVLINFGFLIFREIDVYWFTIPNAGVFYKNCIQGNKEVVGILSKAKWKEMLLSDLEKKKLRFSVLPVSLIVKDLIGKGMAESVTTTSGALIKLKTAK